MRTLTATLILLFASTTALAAPPHGGFHKAGPRILNHADELGLSVEQVASIEAILDEGRAEHEATREDLHTLKKELRGLLSADTVPEAATVSQLVETIGAVETDMKVDRILTSLEIRTVLTPEQWASLKEMRPERRHRDGGRHRRPEKIEGL